MNVLDLIQKLAWEFERQTKARPTVVSVPYTMEMQFHVELRPMTSEFLSYLHDKTVYGMRVVFLPSPLMVGHVEFSEWDRVLWEGALTMGQEKVDMIYHEYA